MSISFILIVFLFHLAAGMMMVLPLLPTQKVAREFLQSVSFWSALFLALAFIFQKFTPFHLPESFGYALDPAGPLIRSSRALVLLFFLITLIFWARLRFTERPITGLRTAAIGLLAGVAVVGVNLLFRPLQLTPSWVINFAVPFNFVSASLLLGGFLVGMLFGHSYLLNTEVPKRLLVTMSWVMMGTIALRVVSVVTTLLLFNYLVFPGTQFLDKMISFAGHGIFFWQRILVGLVIPIGVAVMTWRTALIGSNQSATGIMYVGVAFILIGELMSTYLFFLSGIPL